MSRVLGALMAILVLASCGGGDGYGKAPRDLDNACAILEERPEYARAFSSAARRWGTPVHVQMATLYQESKFISDARTPYRWTLGVIPRGRISSAYGYSQALDGTWDEYLQESGRFRARRTNIDDAADFMGWYMAQSTAELGIRPDDARNQYLAYHEGRSGFARRSYNSKPWLLRVAASVDSRAQRYRAQLATCRSGRLIV